MVVEQKQRWWRTLQIDSVGVESWLATDDLGQHVKTAPVLLLLELLRKIEECTFAGSWLVSLYSVTKCVNLKKVGRSGAICSQTDSSASTVSGGGRNFEAKS